MKLYKYNQVANLDENKKIKLSQLPDSIVGQLTFGGVLNLDPTNNELETFLTQNAQDKFGVSTSGNRVYWKNDTTYNISNMILNAGRLAVGIYFIIGQDEAYHTTITDLSYDFTCGNITNTISITTGDWVIVNVVNGNVSAQIVKVDNTDAVSSVNGKVGVVNLGIGDIDNLQSTLNSKSSVSVSNTGTATDEISYITINGTEKKIAGGGGGGGTQLYKHDIVAKDNANHNYNIRLISERSYNFTLIVDLVNYISCSIEVAPSIPTPYGNYFMNIIGYNVVANPPTFIFIIYYIKEGNVESDELYTVASDTVTPL